MVGYGQSGNAVPTLDNLQSWLKLTYSKFDTEIKKIGFRFKEKNNEEEGVYYYYTRPIDEENNEVILFIVGKEGKNGIEMILGQDFFAGYKAAIKANKYEEENCSALEEIGIDSKQCKEYENDSYRLMLQEWRELSNKKEELRDKYSYTAKIINKSVPKAETKDTRKYAYEITVSMGNIGANTAILGYYLMGKTYSKDTVTVENGKARFTGEKKLDAGIYFIMAGSDNEYATFLVDDNEQKFQLAISKDEGNKGFIINSVTNSKENKLLNDMSKFLADSRKEFNQLSSTDKEGQDRITKRVRNYQEQLIKNNPGSLTALITKVNLEIIIPDALNNIPDKSNRDMQRYLYYKQHFFDYTDLSDPRLLRTSFYSSKIDKYLDDLTSRHPDSTIISIDYLVGLASKNRETYQNTIIYLLNKYAKTQYVCFDKCYVHIADKYYNNSKAPYGGAFWLEKDELDKITASAAKLRPILCNQEAPNVMFSSVSDPRDQFSLISIKSKYTVLFFWQPDRCDKCEKAITRLKEIYTDLIAKGIKIVGVGVRWKDLEANPGIFKDYCESNKMPWISVFEANNKSEELVKKFNIATLPEIYLLDENKKILLKNINVEGLEQYFKNK